MARRIIRRRRASAKRRVVVSRPAQAAAAAPAPAPRAPMEPKASPVVVATSGAVRNLVLPKLSMIDDISLVGLADTPNNALKMLIQERPEAVILDADFGGPFMGLDLAKTMQKTRSQAAIIMLLSDIDPAQLQQESRRFGTSWSYVKKISAGRAGVLEMVLNSAIRGVQWVEPDLTRSLNVIWKVAEQARDLEARKALEQPAPVRMSRDSSRQLDIQGDVDVHDDVEISDEIDPDDLASGYATKTTDENDLDGLNITSVSIGKGGIGTGVGKIRRAG